MDAKEPPPGSGPNGNGCASCPKDKNGNIIPGDVGPLPGIWSREDDYYHWVINRVENRGSSNPPLKQNPLIVCKSGDKNSYTKTWSSEAISVTSTSVGGSAGAGGASGNVSITNSESTSSGLSDTVTVDCSKYDIPPGQQIAFYQQYTRSDWEGIWQRYDCSSWLKGCRPTMETGTASGSYYNPITSLNPVVEPEP
ncbi:hypothetical protein [Nocardia sp. NPDC056000]|uniref:hypothetical protein n=1 Tax=Nocardia sp. NPDC056000 TaxID=3345674 RepID=UPI0035E2B436